MGLTRRAFLRAGSAGLVASSAAPLWLGAGARAFAGEPGAPLLVVVFLRGGADALHLVPPVGDSGYASLRGALALERSLPFARGFGLHPSLAPLQPLVEAGRLAVVHAAGSPAPTRSHFEAQDLVELGIAGAARDGDGWLARALRGEASESAFDQLALAGGLPLGLRGGGGLAIEVERGLGLPDGRHPVRRELERLYAEAEADPVAVAGRQALAAAREYERAMGPSEPRPFRRPARGPELLRGAEQLLALERAGLPLRAVWLESGDWDTHANQGLEDGRMARSIDDLAQALARLDAGLRGRRDYTLVAMSEFGRTVRPNGSGGTDHGHGGAMLVAGGGVRGGLHGDWPSLGASQLYEGRDLPVRVDYRSVLTEVVRAHLGGRPPADTFPGFEPSPIGLLRSA